MGKYHLIFLLYYEIFRSILSKPDCPGGGDESPLCNNDQCSINNGGCSHICHASPFGVLCLCAPGFHVRNTTNYKKCEG
jgi:low density lipoprotein-related protein 2